MNSREDFNDYVNTILNATNFRDGIKHDAKEKLLKYINSHAEEEKAKQREACATAYAAMCGKLDVPVYAGTYDAIEQACLNAVEK